MILAGTILNMATVILGGFIGIIINDRIPDSIKKSVFNGIGLFIFVLGLKMSFESKNLIIIVLSLIVGIVFGEMLKIEDKFEKLSKNVKFKFIKNEKFSEGVMAAFLLFCMGAMTILGAIEEGIKNNHSILITKSIMDGFASVALASTYGMGVIFSVIPMFIYQGGLTIGASFLQKYLNDYTISQLSAIGGLLLMGLSINLLELKKIKVANMLPALLIIFVVSIFIK